MGSLFGGGSSGGDGRSSTPAPTTPTTAATVEAAPLGPYPDDGAKRMPTANSPNAMAAARKKRNQITTRSGRSSTRLVNDTPGTRPYTNSFLGSAG